MKIAIVSDTHNKLGNFKKAIDWIKKEKIQLILHCGDISNQETIDEAVKYFGGDIRFVKGNGDYGLDLPDKMELEFNGKRIAFTHFPDIAKKMAQMINPSTGSGQVYDLVFYGHTHRPWDEKVGECHMINPGELAGQFYKPTFAIYDLPDRQAGTAIGKLELKILEQL
jgi:putative phosphoesterase